MGGPDPAQKRSARLRAANVDADAAAARAARVPGKQSLVGPPVGAAVAPAPDTSRLAAAMRALREAIATGDDLSAVIAANDVRHAMSGAPPVLATEAAALLARAPWPTHDAMQAALRGSWDAWDGEMAAWRLMQGAPMAAEPAADDLTAAERERITRWFGTANVQLPATVNRDLLAVVVALDADPPLAFEFLYLMFATPHARLTDIESVRRVVERARFESERKRLGVAAPSGFEPNAGVDAQPARAMSLQVTTTPVSNTPLRFAIAGASEHSSNWSHDAGYAEHRMCVVDWVFEPLGAGGARTATEHVHYELEDEPAVVHSFAAGAWRVHAFVRRPFAQPAHLTSELALAPQAHAMRQLRDAAFGDMQAPDPKTAVHHFEVRKRDELARMSWLFSGISLGRHLIDAFRSHDDTAIDGDYDGVIRRGKVVHGFQPKPAEARAVQRLDRIAKIESLIAFLEAERSAGDTHEYDDAIDAATEHVAHLRLVEAALRAEDPTQVREVEIRGTFFSKQMAVASGPLELYATVRPRSFTKNDLAVQVHDVSERVGAQTLIVSGTGPTFAAALEAAFIDLCKAYPEGQLAIVAQDRDWDGTETTGETIGFELPTTSPWKRAKALLTSKPVQAAEIALMVFLPEIGVPLMAAQDALLSADEIVDRVDTGQPVTWGELSLDLGKLALDVLPFAAAAKPLSRASKFVSFQTKIGFGVNAAGSTIVMAAGVHAAIMKMQEDAIPALAVQHAEVEAYAAAHPDDPSVAVKRAGILAQAGKLSADAREMWIGAAAQHVGFLIGGHALGKLRQAPDATATETSASETATEPVDAEIAQLGPRWAHLVGDAAYEGRGRFQLTTRSGEIVVEIRFVKDLAAVRATSEDGHAVIEVPDGVRGTALERAAVGKLTELQHASATAPAALSPAELGQVAELRALRLRQAEARGAGPAGAEKVAALDGEITDVERALGVVGDSPQAVARRKLVEIAAEVQNDAARRVRVRAELDGERGHPGIDLHSHFPGVVRPEVFRARAAAARGGDPKSWVPLLEVLADLTGPEFRHEMSGGRIAKRAPAGDATQIARDARAQVRELVRRARETHDESEASAYRRGAEIVAEDACTAALTATPDSDFNSAYAIIDELVKRTFGGAAVAGETPEERQLRAYDDLIDETLLELARRGISYSEQSISISKLAQKLSPARIRARQAKLIEEGKLAPGAVEVRVLAMSNTAHYGERDPALPDVPAPPPHDDDDFDNEQAKIAAHGGDPSVVGQDIAGPEHFTMQSARLQKVYANQLELAKQTGTPTVYRPHVGEGAIDTAEGEPFSTDKNRLVAPSGELTHYDRAHANIETLLKMLEARRKAGTYDPSLVQVRLGHVAHADPDQLLRMKELGVVAEVNLGSNAATGAVSQTAGIHGERAPEEQFDDHAFGSMIFYDVTVAIGTDGGGVMNTSPDAEFARANSLLEEILAGRQSVEVRADDANGRGTEVPGVPSRRALTIYEMTPEERGRFERGYETLYDDAEKLYMNRARPEAGTPHHTAPAREHGLTRAFGGREFEGSYADVTSAADAYRAAGYRVSTEVRAGNAVAFTIASKDGTFQTVLRSVGGDAEPYIPTAPPADAPLAPAEARQSYLDQVGQIAELDATWEADGVALDVRAHRAYDIRHNARLATREQQSPGDAAALEVRDTTVYGDPDGPSFDALVARLQGEGLSLDDVYRRIIGSSQRTNADYNACYGTGEQGPGDE
jgi:hypothetical protein